MRIEHRAELRPDLRISAAMVAASEMLELPAQALDSLVEEALADNPVLERLDPGECAVCRDRWTTRCPACSPGARAPGRADGRGLAAAVPAGGLDRPAPQGDADALLALVRQTVRAGDRPIAEYVIASLDPHGRLDQAPADIAAALGAPEAAVHRVLAAVRQNGPPGVGASSAAECLLLQLDALDLAGDEVALVARAVIAAHLPALAKGHLAAIAAALGTSPDRVAQARQLIRDRLRPYPAFEGRAPRPAAAVVPDLVIRAQPGAPGEFDVALVQPRRLRVGIAARYLDAPPPRGRADSGRADSGRADSGRDDSGRSDASRLRERVADARCLLGQLADRWETLQRVASCTVERQKEFVRHGSGALQPLTRAEVAQALGLHQSTVSRAAAGKYAMLPSRRIIPLAAFFSASGGLGDELRHLVAGEDRPLSDAELAARLCSRGYPVARRTVTKYRIRLGIAAAAQR
jgi:RNA polymerase sigma-54 factor